MIFYFILFFKKIVTFVIQRAALSLGIYELFFALIMFKLMQRLVVGCIQVKDSYRA